MTSDRQRKILGAIGGLVAVTFIAWGLVINFGIMDDPPGRVRTADVGEISGFPDRDVDIILDENTDLDENLETYIGKTAAVRGEIVESETADVRTFSLDIDGAFGNDEILMIRKASAWQGRLDDGTVIQAVGEVRRVDPVFLRELNAELNLDLSDDQINSFDQKLLMIADEITIPAH